MKRSKQLMVRMRPYQLPILITAMVLMALVGYKIIYHPRAATTASNFTLNDNTTGTGTNQFNYSGSPGTWAYDTSNCANIAYHGDCHYNTSDGAYYQVQFNGTGVSVYSIKASDEGIEDIYIDGTKAGSADLYNATTLASNVVYSTTALASGNHTLKVMANGKNASSTGFGPFADRVDIIGSTSPPPPSSPIVIGAIRWDWWNANHQDPSDPYVATHNYPQLLCNNWAPRVPFYGHCNGPNDYIREDLQSVMDQEIQMAHSAGLDYWAFNYDPYGGPDPADNTGLNNYGINLYHSSPYKNQINFSILMYSDEPKWPANWTTEVANFVNWFKEPTYQKVDGGRPLFYIHDSFLPSVFGSLQNAQNAITYLRNQTLAAGLPSPYIVETEGDSGIGIDAVSKYAQGGGNGSPYSGLAQLNQSYWSGVVASGHQVVPNVSLGWDPRPLASMPYNSGSSWFQLPTQNELRDNFIAAMNFIHNNPSATPANTILAYAWNETAEGGIGFVPNAGYGSLALNALTAARSAIATTPPSTKPGDVNGDGVINITDLSIIASHFGQSGQTLITGDLNGDGIVNVIDLSILAAHWGS